MRFLAVELNASDTSEDRLNLNLAVVPGHSEAAKNCGKLVQMRTGVSEDPI